MLRRCALGVLAWSWGCSPEVITAGYVEAHASFDSAPSDAGGASADAAPPPGTQEAGWLEPTLDAQPPDSSDAGLADAATSPAEAGAARVCFHLPDLLSEDAGAPRSREEGEIIGGVDEHWNCSPPAAATVTYARRDGAPLLRAGQKYALATPAGPGGSINFYHANEACLQAWHSMIFYLALPAVPACSELTMGEDRRFLRAPLAKPTPFPSGITLCEGSCPAP